MGLCVAREDDFEEDRRAYDAYTRLHSEVQATLNDHARLQRECAQSFRAACTDRCVSELTKPLLMEMTFHFIRRLQCDSNERLVRAVMQDLDRLCPRPDEAVSEVKFTEFTQIVLRIVERELRERLNRLNQKSGGMFGAVGDRQRGEVPGGVVPPTITSDPTVGRVQRGMTSHPGLPPHAAPEVLPAAQPPPEPEKRRFVADLLPGTGNLDPPAAVLQPQRLQQPQLQRPQQLQSQQPQQDRAQQHRSDMEATFDPNNLNPGQQEVPLAEDAMSSVDGKLRSSPAAEYEEQKLEAMKQDILTGNLHVQVYNRNYEPEVKRLCMNGKMGLIAIFGNDGKAVASFGIRDLQCLTRGIARTILDPAPDPTVTSAFRFKDNFLCVQFDNEVQCHYALKAFSSLCGVPIYDASDPGAQPPRSSQVAVA